MRLRTLIVGCVVAVMLAGCGNVCKRACKKADRCMDGYTVDCDEAADQCDEGKNKDFAKCVKKLSCDDIKDGTKVLECAADNGMAL